MKKYMSLIVLSALSTTALAHGKWDVGVAVGAGIGRAPTTIKTTEAAVPPSTYKFTHKSSGPAGGLRVGYTVSNKKFIYGLQLGAYKDFYKVTNQGYKHDIVSNLNINNSTNDVKRKYTLEISGKFGSLISTDIQLYGKLGLLRSAFIEQYKDADRNDGRGKTRGWGGVAGLGIQKHMADLNIGLEYAYHHYERLSTTLRYGTGNSIQNKSKFTPQYHNIFLTLSKSF